jgi:hypothetical protein
LVFAVLTATQLSGKGMSIPNEIPSKPLGAAEEIHSMQSWDFSVHLQSEVSSYDGLLFGKM